MIMPLPGGWDEKPGSATLPFFGVIPLIVDEKGNEITESPAEGYLCIKQVSRPPMPLPSSPCPPSPPSSLPHFGTTAPPPLPPPKHSQPLTDAPNPTHPPTHPATEDC